jgi:hypothetical protein
VKVEAEMDRLYGLPLEDFTAARNDLAGELKTAGETDAAAEVKTLPKPSLSAWTVNQLARRERMQVRALITAAGKMRTAQSGLLAGGGAADDLQQAVERQREVVDALVASARALLEASGASATQATLDRVRGTLTAVAADEEGQRLVEKGRLSADLDPSGFGPVAPGAPAGGRTRKAKRPSPSSRATEKARRDVEQLRAEAAELKERVRRARNEARRAERAAGAARKAAAKDEAELEQLTTRLDRAVEAFERARSGRTSSR